MRAEAEVPVGSIAEKVLIALALTVFCSSAFFGLGVLNAARAARGFEFWSLETWLDDRVAFDARWIWIYLSYYPGCFLPIVTWRNGALFRQVALGYGIEFAVCALCFALIPARMAQPAVAGTGLDEMAVRRLFEIDPGYNIFPSLHVANVFFVAAACARWDRRLGWVLWPWAALISISTVTVKQHYVVDVFAGAALAALTIWIALRRWDGLTARERERLRDHAPRAPAAAEALGWGERPRS